MPIRDYWRGRKFSKKPLWWREEFPDKRLGRKSYNKTKKEQREREVKYEANPYLLRKFGILFGDNHVKFEYLYYSKHSIVSDTAIKLYESFVEMYRGSSTLSTKDVKERAREIIEGVSENLENFRLWHSDNCNTCPENAYNCEGWQLLHLVRHIFDQEESDI